MTPRQSNRNQRDVLAFVHIEKAAGTSMIHLLRRNFFCRYLDARPMTGRSGNVFTAADLKLAMRIHPGLRCIGGHTVRPTQEILENMPWIRFVTFLRDPVARYYSHYRYWTRRMNRELSLEDFLGRQFSWNFQTTKIAGKKDVDCAKRMLAENFLIAGLVEQFDESLVHLQRTVEFLNLDLRYSVANQGKLESRDEDTLERYRDRITEVNQLDIELYGYVRDTLFPKYRQAHGHTLNEDIRRVQSQVLHDRPRSWRYMLDTAFRRALLNPLVGAIRVRHGLSSSGSYGY